MNIVPSIVVERKPFDKKIQIKAKSRALRRYCYQNLDVLLIRPLYFSAPIGTGVFVKYWDKFLDDSYQEFLMLKKKN